MGWKKRKEMKTVAESGQQVRGVETAPRDVQDVNEERSRRHVFPKCNQKKDLEREACYVEYRTNYTSSSLPFLINAGLFVHNECTCYRTSSLLETIVLCDLRSGRSMMWMQAGVHRHRLPVYFIKSMRKTLVLFE